MKITPEMKVKEALEVNEKMLDAFTWLAPEFERLRYPKLRRAMSGRVSDHASRENRPCSFDRGFVFVESDGGRRRGKTFRGTAALNGGRF